jgi:hypothetical protein
MKLFKNEDIVQDSFHPSVDKRTYKKFRVVKMFISCRFIIYDYNDSDSE